MLKYDTGKGVFEEIAQSNLKEKKLLERYDLQAAIIGSWDLFKNEIGFPSAFLVGQEITPDDTTQDSIDILAYDADDSSLIVIELKRDKNKLQLLQSLSYAAMVSKWDNETIINAAKKQKAPELEELIDIIEGTKLNSDVKIIMVAEKYDPEVIVTADWLSTNYGMNVSAFALQVHTLNDQTFIDLDQRYPLRELSDAYETRKSNKGKRKSQVKDVTWDDVIPKLKYPFAEMAVKRVLTHAAGDPSRRRFVGIRSNIDGFDRFGIYFRAKYINVYMRGTFEGDHELVSTKFREPLKFGRWREGSSFLVETESQFEDLVKWLNL